jgi:hypothetical protein
MPYSEQQFFPPPPLLQNSFGAGTAKSRLKNFAKNYGH